MVTKCRRKEDLNPGDHTILADTMKLFGNSGYGKTITNKTRFNQVSFCDTEEALTKINGSCFKMLDELSENLYEVEEFKKKVVQDLPLQIGFFVYQEAKLHMLKFYYDVIDCFLDRRDFQYCAMDTDSAYVAIAGNSLGALVPEAKTEEFYRQWASWFPAEVCDAHREAWITRKGQGKWAPKHIPIFCEQRALKDKRTPGLFKLEWSGKGIIAPCCKTYYCFGPAGDKLSCKGVSKRLNQLTKDHFMDLIDQQIVPKATNKGFTMKGGAMYTYTQERCGLTYFYGKRPVMADGVSTQATQL